MLLCVASATLAWRSTLDAGRDLAGDAVVTASSTEPGFSVRDVVTSGSASLPGAGWQSHRETTGAWVELGWQETHLLREVTIVRNPVDEPGVTDGFLSLSDGSFLQVKLSATARETTIPISPRSVDRLRFTVSGVSAGAQNVALAEIIVSATSGGNDVATDDTSDGNLAPIASITQSDGAADPRGLQDGSGVAGVAGLGTEWTAAQPTGAWVQFDWAHPRELSSVQLVGSPGSASNLTKATLSFGDGSRLPVGAVLAEPDRPTVISFMPRVTTSVRLNIDGVSGPGSLTLGEMRVYQSGSTPVRSLPSALPDPPLTASDRCDPAADAPPESGLVITCPRSGSVVDNNVLLTVSAPGYSSVTATVWPANGELPPGDPVRTVPDPLGAAELPVDMRDIPPGPLTVVVEASGGSREAKKVFYQLYRRGAETGADVPPSAQAAGRTLAYADEFNRPVTLSRTGIGADYAAAKPTYWGAADFGGAIFADPAKGFGNVKVVDDRYLRIEVEPSPAGYSDPEGWGRTHLGGLLASARHGGAGFSAQYGYFEARMLAPAAPGTWPAFWTLPSDNLIAPTPVEAEFDAVELYGHDPKMACQSTHAHHGGEDDGIAQCGQRFASERTALSWHTYGVSVTPTAVVFYVDGEEVATAPQVEGGGAPMFFLINLALDGGWPIDLTAVQGRATLYVDYVRVYV